MPYAGALVHAVSGFHQSHLVLLHRVLNCRCRGLRQVVRGCWPFVLVLILMVPLLITFREINPWLPSLMK